MGAAGASSHSKNRARDPSGKNQMGPLPLGSRRLENLRSMGLGLERTVKIGSRGAAVHEEIGAGEKSAFFAQQQFGHMGRFVFISSTGGIDLDYSRFPSALQIDERHREEAPAAVKGRRGRTCFFSFSGQGRAGLGRLDWQHRPTTARWTDQSRETISYSRLPRPNWAAASTVWMPCLDSIRSIKAFLPGSGEFSTAS